jgi:hypothetical protein
VSARPLASFAYLVTLADRSPRTVAHLEARQEIADRAQWRMERLCLRLSDESFAASRALEALRRAPPPRGKRARAEREATVARLTAEHRAKRDRSLDLAARIDGARHRAWRWGRMKARVGVYEPENYRPWRDARPGEIPHAERHGIARR